mgnify:FL=1
MTAEQERALANLQRWGWESDNEAIQWASVLVGDIMQSELLEDGEVVLTFAPRGGYDGGDTSQEGETE